jgi:MFS family permease
VKRFNRDVRLYMASMAIYSFTLMNGIYPVLFNLYLLRLGYGPAFVGTVNSVGLLGTACFALPAGALSARWGLRRTMVIGLFLVLLFYGLLPLIAFLPPDLHQIGILGCRLLGAIGRSMYTVNAVPFLMASSDPENRNSVYSFQVVASQLMGFVGSLLGGVLPEWLAGWFNLSLEGPLPYRYPLVIGAGVCLLAVWAMSRTREIHVKEEPDPREAVGNGASGAPVTIIMVLATAAMLQTAVVGTSKTFFNVYLDDALRIPTSQIGAFFAAVQIVSAASASVMPRLTERWGTRAVFIGSSFGSALSMLPLALVPYWPAALLGRMGISACASITFPALNVFQMEVVAARWRSRMCGTVNMAKQISWMILSLGGGYMITALSYRALFLLGMTVTVLGTLLFWGYFRVPRGEYARREADEEEAALTCGGALAVAESDSSQS